MGRKSVMIAFDPAAFRDVVKGHGKALADLEPVTGVSKQAINGWLSSAKIPPRQLHTIAQGLKWKSNEVARILKKPGFQEVCFRTHRNVEAGDGAKNTAKRLAADLFTLDSLGGDYNKESFVFRVGKDAPASAVADGILRQLNLKRGQFGLEELVLSLARVNVSVVFLDFGRHFSLDETAAKNLKAFCAKQGPRFIITIDSQMKGSQVAGEDVIWAIFHELAHIACGDMDDGADDFWEDSKSKEKFRNEVASEVLTPTDLLLASKPELEKFLNCAIQLLPSRVERVASELGASFVGVVLALKKINILTTQMERYLWGVQKRRDLTRPRIKDFISPPQAKSREDLISEWGRVLNNENLLPFLKLPLLVRQGLIEERLSMARAAELLGVEVGEMEELAKQWAAEVSDEAAD
jgi:Zn-dependent peptidase ImmA (M78 family)